MDERARHIIQKLCQPDENIIWSGRPNAAIVAIRNMPSLVFSIFFVIIVWSFVGKHAICPRIESLDFLICSQYYKTTRVDFGDNFTLVAALFVVAAVSVFISSIIEVIRAWNIYYGVTNKRVMIVCTFPFEKVVSLPPSKVGPIMRTGGDRKGTLSFKKRTGSWFDGHSPYRPAFVGIDKPRDVERLILKTFSMSHYPVSTRRVR